MAENIKNLGKVCITPEGVWDVNKEYDRLSLVVTTDVNTQKALSYVSRKHVPKGNINIKDTEYWQLFTTELKLEDITIDENGNVKIGDVVIYQIPLGDALGEIVVNKIKHDLTDYIMAEIRSYMTSMVQELINSFSNQISRLINTGIEIRNKVSGGMTNHNIDEITHYGNINLKHSGGTNNTNTEEIRHSGNIGINNSGRIENIISGNINTNVKVNGELYVDGDEPAPVTKYTVVVNTTPSDAVVTLNGVQTNTGEFDEGSTILVVVSKSGYITRMETITNIQQNATLNINLVEEQTQYYVDVYTTPSDAIVKLNGTVGNHLLFNKGETITVEVSKEGYVTHTEYINNLQENTNITVILDEEAVQYIFIVNPTEKAVGATSSQFPIEVRSVRNNQGYDYEYITEDPDNLIQSIVKETGGVKVITNGNALDRTKTATIYFKQHRPEEEVIHVTIPFVITQETDTPSSYIFTSNLINNWNNESVNNYLGGVPVGGNAYTSPNGIDITSTKNGESFDYNITEKPSWINFTKDLQNNKLNFALDAVELSSTLTQIRGKVVLTQRDSGKTLEFTLIRCKGYIYVIDSPLTYNKNAHYTEDLKIITGFCNNNTGFGYTPGQPSLSSQDAHPNWIGIDDSSFENAQLISTSYYYYYNVRFGIQKNEGNQRTGTVIIIIGGDSDINYPIEFTQEGEDTPTPTTKYTVTVNPTPSDALVTLNDGLNPGEFDAGTDVRVFVSKYGYIAHEETITNLQENKTLNITLEQETDEFYAAQTDMQFTLDGGQLPNTIVSLKNGSFIGYVLTSKPEWATVTLDYEGDQNRINVVVGNTSSARSGNIVLTQNETGNTLTIGVSQNNTYELNVATKSFNIVSGGEQKSTFYTSTLNGNYVDPIVTPSDNWITYQLLSNGNNHYIQITVAENTATSQRTGTISVVNGDKSETINITQDAAPAQDTYEFSSDKQSLSFAAADGSQQTAKVTSTKNGSRIDTSIDSKPGWITVNQVIDETGTNYLFTAAANSSTESRSGNIVVKQQRGSSFETITIAVTQEGSSTPPTPTYEFVGILTGEGGDYEQDLTTAIRLTTSANQVTLTPRVKIDGQLRTDVDVNITANGFSQGAQNTNKFNVNNSGTALTIQTAGEEPSEPISTSYDITVNYDGHVESATFAIDWDV